jgi:hypothetical protein
MQTPTKNEMRITYALGVFHIPALFAVLFSFGTSIGLALGYLMPDAALTVWFVAVCLGLATVVAVAGYIPEEMTRKGIRDELARRSAQSGKR